MTQVIEFKETPIEVIVHELSNSEKIIAFAYVLGDGRKTKIPLLLYNASKNTIKTLDDEEHEGGLEDIVNMLTSEEFYKVHPLRILFNEEDTPILMQKAKDVVRHIGMRLGLIPKRNKVIVSEVLPEKSYMILIKDLKKRAITHQFVIGEVHFGGERFIATIAMKTEHSYKVPEQALELIARNANKPVKEIVKLLEKELIYAKLSE